MLPEVEKRPRRVLERVATELREKGHQVTTLSADQFGQPAAEAPLTSGVPKLNASGTICSVDFVTACATHGWCEYGRQKR